MDCGFAIIAIFTVTFGYIIPNFTKQVAGHESFFCTIFKNIIKSCTVPGELKELNRQLKTCKEKKMADCPEAYKALALIKDRKIKVTNDCDKGLEEANCKTDTSEIVLLNGKEELGKLKQDFLLRTCEGKDKPGHVSSLCTVCDYYLTLFNKDSKPQVTVDYGGFISKATYPVKSMGVTGKYVCLYYGTQEEGIA